MVMVISILYTCIEFLLSLYPNEKKYTGTWLNKDKIQNDLARDNRTLPGLMTS